MIEFALGFVVGLVVGWNFFPQPGFVKQWLKGVGLFKSEETKE